MKFPWSLLKGCWIILSHNYNAKQLLASYLSLLLSQHKKVYLIKYTKLKEDLLMLLTNNLVKKAILDNIILIDATNSWKKPVIENPGNNHLIIYEPPFTPLYCKDQDCIIFKTPPLKKKVKYCKTVYLKHIVDQEYILRTGTESIRIVISPRYIGLSKGLQGILSEALDLLRRSIVEYGELTVKDAIDLIVFNLGVKKDEARKILSTLIQRKYVEVSSNHIIVY